MTSTLVVVSSIAFAGAAGMLGGCGSDSSPGTPTGTSSSASSSSASSTSTGPGAGGSGAGSTASSASTGGGGAGAAGGGGAGGTAGGGGAPTVLWAKQLGAAMSDVGRGVAVDGAGDVFVTGHFAATVDFGGGAIAAAGAEDIFVVKLDAAGNHTWSRGFGDVDDDEGRAIGVDGAGNVYVAATFQGTVDFGGGPLTSAGQKDLALVKLGPDGDHVWSRRIGGPMNDSAPGLAVAPSGDLLLAGELEGTLDFGGGPVAAFSSTRDVFVARYTTDGDLAWVRHYGDAALFSSADDAAVAFAGDAAVVTGRAFGPVDLGSGAVTGLFVLELDAAGNHVFDVAFTSSDTLYPTGVAVDGAGAIWLAGGFSGTVDFGGGPKSSAGGNDVFLVKLDASGNELVTASFGDAAAQDPFALAASGDRVVLTGSFEGAIDFGGGSIPSAGGFGDGWIAGFDLARAHRWSMGFGDAAPSVQEGNAVAIDGAGNTVVCGTFGGTVDLGSGPLTSAGGVDALVVKLAP